MSDLISRKEAVDRITDGYQNSGGGKDRYAVGINVGLTKALNVLKDVPSAEPKRGEWDIEISESMHQATYRCSECGYQFRWVYDQAFPPVFNFCMKCGADMRGEHETD